MNKGLWEIAAVIFVFGVLCYGAWTVRNVLGDLFFLFMSLILICFLLLAAIEVRHWHRRRELEYLRMTHHVNTEIRVIESDNESEPVAMIEPPKRNVVRFSEWAESNSQYIDELPPLPTTEPEPIVLARKTNVLPEDELSVAERHFKGGASNREKLAKAMKISNRKARDFIEELKRRKLV